jgi:hypothetical protein
MPSTLKQYDPSLREKIAAMLQGDAKQGSMRAHIARAMAGSSVGGEADGIPLLDLTPAGVAFSANDADRALNKGQYGQAAMAMAGMIPAARLPAGALEGAADLLRHYGGDAEKTIKELVANGYNSQAAKSAVHHVNEASLAESRLPKMDRADPNRVADMRMMQEVNAGKRAIIGGVPQRDPNLNITAKGYQENYQRGQSMRESLERNARPEAVPTTSRELKDRRLGGLEAQDFPSGSDEAADFKRMHELDAEDVAGGDPDKLNFIKNAMDDEGGNVPEDVAMTLFDSADQADSLLDLMTSLGIDPSIGGVANKDLIINKLMDTYSIPEMLAMHYDLDPKTLGAAYKSGKTMRRPTQ